MRDVPKIRAWVVYETVAGPHAGRRFVCTEDEWRVVEAQDQSTNRIVKEQAEQELDSFTKMLKP